MQPGHRPRLNAPLLAKLLRRNAGIVAGTAVASQLAPDRTGAASEQPGDDAHGMAFLVQRGQRHALLRLQVLVLSSHVCNLPELGRCTSLLRSPGDRTSPGISETECSCGLAEICRADYIIESAQVRPWHVNFPGHQIIIGIIWDCRHGRVPPAIRGTHR